MRSNIARTSAARAPPSGASLALAPSAVSAAAARLSLLELGEEIDDRFELGVWQMAEGGHRRDRVVERPRDRLLRDARADVREFRPGTGVAVARDVMAGLAARLGDAQAPGFELRDRRRALRDDRLRGLDFKRCRGADRRAIVGEEGHRADDEDQREHRNRAALGAALGA